MEFLKKIRDGLMGVEYESEEEEYEYVDDYEDERGYGPGDQSGYFARFDRDEREEDRPSKSKKKTDRSFLGFSKEAGRGRRSRSNDYDYEAPRASTFRRSSTDSKILSLPTATSFHGESGSSPRIMLFSPETLEDARPVCANLKSDVICVINLERLDKAVAQRIADFLGGACDALNGSIQRISHDIFLIAPENVVITSQVREELKNNGLILPWVQTAFRK